MPPEPADLCASVHLDLINACLWRGPQGDLLRPKTFAVLRCLLAHPGQLVTKAALLDAVWPETTVTDVALMICIRELRQALGDNPRTPRFIETMHRRGYRFVGDLPVTAPPFCSSQSVARSAVSPVGREAELTRLHAWLALALRGIRQMVFVTGEAGPGKTTLVEAFVAELGNHGTLWIGRGQCIEHYGAGEAYLPVLEALGRLCREPGGRAVVALLGQRAPTWLVQMPGLVRAADLEALRRRVDGATREQLVDRLARLVHQRTEGNPLFIVALVESWRAHGILLKQDGVWVLPGGVEALHDSVPDSLQQMIDMQLDRLSAEEQRVLEAVSGAGVEFSAATAAAGLAQELEPVDDWCTSLVRRGQLLQTSGERTWPDGTVAGCYGFVHALYQQVLYQRVSAAQRVRLY
jgi:DNA-binding winged helix-turn-helix (wHTH) protein